MVISTKEWSCNTMLEISMVALLLEVGDEMEY